MTTRLFCRKVDGQHGQHGIEILALSIKSKRLAIQFERESFCVAMTEPLLEVHRCHCQWESSAWMQSKVR
jgi:hypothetical protein